MEDFSTTFVDMFREMPDKVKEMFAQKVYQYNSEEDYNGLKLLLEVISFPIDCESPIEKILMYALDICMLDGCTRYHLDCQVPVQCKNNKHYILDIFYDEGCFEPIENPIQIAIECDGHEFHEKTREQVEKRNQRDMDLRNIGIETLHYSGSQIFRNPYKCAKEIISYIDKRVAEKYGTTERKEGMF